MRPTSHHERFKIDHPNTPVHIFDLPDSVDGFNDDQVVRLLRQDAQLPRKNGVIIATPDWQQGGYALSSKESTNLEKRLSALVKIAKVFGFSERDALLILAPFVDTINQLSWDEIQLYALSLFSAYDLRKNLKSILGQASEIDIIVPQLATGNRRRDIRGVLLAPSCVDQFCTSWQKAQTARMPVIATGFVLNSSRPQELRTTIEAVEVEDDTSRGLFHTFSVRSAAVIHLLLTQSGCPYIAHTQRNGDPVLMRSIMDATTFLSRVSKRA